MTQKPHKIKTVLIVAILGAVGAIIAATITVIGNYNVEKMRQKAELTRIALASIATQTAETSKALIANTPNNTPIPVISITEPTETVDCPPDDDCIFPVRGTHQNLKPNQDIVVFVDPGGGNWFCQNLDFPVEISPNGSWEGEARILGSQKNGTEFHIIALLMPDSAAPKQQGEGDCTFHPQPPPSITDSGSRLITVFAPTTPPSLCSIDESGKCCTDNGNGGETTIKVEPLRTVTGIRIDLIERALKQFGFSLWEVEIYGPDANNLAIDAIATASSSQLGFGCGDCSPDKAIDGDVNNTRWASDFKEPEWFEITLPESRIVYRIVLKWEAAYAKRYCVTLIE